MKLDLHEIYTDYLISQNQQATATGLSNLLDGQISHEKITRFLNHNLRGLKELWQYVKKQVHHLEQDIGGVLIIDDTIEIQSYLSYNLALAQMSWKSPLNLYLLKKLQKKLIKKGASLSHTTIFLV
ncbi:MULTISPECIES: hypothetical protein [unclassified Neochlamydia]|uniref:hypothetical protein n=1 Tax=unclassified Neochlamydia TaxID=2643326 RepID=UPI0014086D2A|nr:MULTISPECIES: hypothetical protein [unclassified Neochlamydia]MBS4167169.1 hypothetical protein [Neochlamydia sp. AcF65]MBS4171402.1 hypothetical protein [Neochlamydia sp. AcF95]NGY95231.1 hypothetical protein [Neochlamydia sp. AcF84]